MMTNNIGTMNIEHKFPIKSNETQWSP